MVSQLGIKYEGGSMDIEKEMGAIKRVASRLVSPACDIYDDLVQEMCLAILEAERGHVKSWYLERAKSRAINYLRSKKNYYSYDNTHKRVRLPATRRQI